MTTQPASKTVNAGQSVSFTAVTLNPGSTDTVQWQVSTNGGTSFSNIAGATSTTYAFTSTAAENGDEYQAVFTNSNGTLTSNAATLTIDSITTQPGSQSVNAGQSVSFTAATANGSADTVQWQVSTDGGTTFTNISGATSTTYTFTSTAAENGDEYQAVFTNAGGTLTTTAATLTVDSVTTQPASQTIVAGQNVSFTAASLNPSGTDTVQWQVSTDGGTTFTNIAGATSTTYSFTTTSGETGDEYQAVFTNSAGSFTSNAATLTIAVAPSVTSQPASEIADDGGTASFTATASGVPAPTVQWQVSTDGGTTFADIAGATSSTYSFTPTTAESGYEYQAVFTNMAGTVTSNPATLTVDSITAQPG